MGFFAVFLKIRQEPVSESLQSVGMTGFLDLHKVREGSWLALSIT